MSLRLPFALPFFALLLMLGGCETSKPVSTSVARSANTRMVVPDNPVLSIAQREIIRRQERIRAADTAAISAGQRSSSGDYEGARAEYSRALDTLPE